MKYIETERLILGRYKEDDLERLHGILSDPVTMSYWPAPFTLEQTKKWIELSMESNRELGFGRWPVFLKSTGQFIGDCGLKIAEINGRQENDLGYIIHHPYWRQGYGLEAARACKLYALEELKFDRLCANMAYDNMASMHVAEKLGMHRECEFYNTRNRGILTYLYSLERDDFDVSR